MSKWNSVTVTLLLFLGLQVTSAYIADICRYEADGTRLPLSKDCARFVVCQERRVSTIGRCPRGLHFNRELAECDFQWRADCSGLTAFVEDDTCNCDCCADECMTTEAPTTEAAKTDNTPCDTDSTASPDVGITDSIDPDINESSLATTTATAITPTATTPRGDSAVPTPSGLAPAYCGNDLTDCVNVANNKKLPVNGDCGKFITCNGGCAVVQQCPSGLYYDFTRNVCDYIWNVDCTQTVFDDPPVGPSGTTCDDQGVCAGQRDGVMFADPNTNGYLVCQCQCPIAMPCDVNTKFNEKAQVCDWDGVDGSSSVVCPDNLVYNATSDQCDYPVGYVPDVVCSSTSTICQGQPEGTLFPMDGVCNKFYKCNFNCAVEQLCPNNLIYDTKYQLCNYPQNVECPWEYTPPSGPNAGPSGISCEANGRCLGQREGTFLSSLTSCSGYAVCQCECEIDMECGEGLYWDPKLLTCNYAKNVDCTL